MCALNETRNLSILYPCTRALSNSSCSYNELAYDDVREMFGNCSGTVRVDVCELFGRCSVTVRVMFMAGVVRFDSRETDVTHLDCTNGSDRALNQAQSSVVTRLGLWWCSGGVRGVWHDVTSVPRLWNWLLSDGLQGEYRFASTERLEQPRWAWVVCTLQCRATRIYLVYIYI
jgi:hypothetical protein